MKTIRIAVARKSPKPSKKGKIKTQKQRRKGRKTPSRPVVGTYDSWLSSEVGKRGHRAVSKQSSSTVPVDTFQEWMKKQQVKERIERSEPTNVPSTFDDWMGREVARKQAQPEDVQTTQIQPVQNGTTEIVVKPASHLVNQEKSEEESAS